MTRRRGFGELVRRVGATGPSYRARYAMPDGTRHSRNFRTKMDAEARLASERSLIDRDEWTPPKARTVAEARRELEQAMSTVKAFAERYVAERGLRPTTARRYEALLKHRIVPYFGAMPLRDVLGDQGVAPHPRSEEGVVQRGGVPAAALDTPGC